MSTIERAPGVIIKTVISAVLLGMGTTALWISSPPDPPYKMVDEVVTDLGHWEHRLIRVHGWVVAGTIVRVTPHITSFQMQKSGKRLAVWFEGVLPDTFKDQSEVVVRGAVHGDTLMATQILAKCGGKYDGPRDLKTRYY